MTFAASALLLISAYLLGAIPFGLLIGLTRGLDIRRYGSGNTGATNALRTVGLRASAIVFFLDVAKAVIPVLVARWLVGDPTLEAACGIAAVVGHNWPVYIGWKGGKGVSSGLGVMAVLSPLATLLGALIGIVLIGRFRYVSLGSMAGASSIPLFTATYSIFVSPLPLPYVVASFVLGAMTMIQHRSNIQRLLAGSERKLGDRIEDIERVRQS